MSTSVYILCKK